MNHYDDNAHTQGGWEYDPESGGIFAEVDGVTRVLFGKSVV